MILYGMISFCGEGGRLLTSCQACATAFYTETRIRSTELKINTNHTGPPRNLYNLIYFTKANQPIT